MGRRPAATANRAPVNSQRALIVAYAVADGDGIEAVTMRRLARELGVEAASLHPNQPAAGVDNSDAFRAPGSCPRRGRVGHPGAVSVVLPIPTEWWLRPVRSA